ncbi:MAG: replication-associated recombination protein A [Candidatus Eisenbacteria bacterium]
MDLFGSDELKPPLAERMRPRTVDEFVGQTALLAPGRPLREAIEKGAPGSMIFWGPPGTGKTTLARLIARHAKHEFVSFSGVSDGVPKIREIMAQAEERRKGGRGTILFVDEIHRLNKAQQDALLPHAERGTVTLIGATTENPSFEVNGALLSRTRVFVLKPLTPQDLETVLARALEDAERGLGALGLIAEPDAIARIALEADGDARRALTALEAAADHAGSGGTITVADAEDALQRRFAHYDKAGEQHFNHISAYHKALRGSDPQGALYWLARMIAGGEDPLYVARRTIRFAAEDVGLADPQALALALAARDAYHMLGSPEGEIALAEAAIYLATCPKSNRVYRAWGAALEAARVAPAAPVPLHIRNAPTGLMKELGYGAGYRYAHDAPEAYAPQDYLPDELRERAFYQPGAFGAEVGIAERMRHWAELKRRAAADSGPDPEAS